MKRKNLRYASFLFVCLLCTAKTFAQEKEPCGKEIVPAIEAPRDTESGEKYFPDSLKKSIRLIFEKDFNDSIVILLNDRIVYDSVVVTMRPYGAFVRFIDVDYSKIKKGARLTIRKKNGECMWFCLKPGYRVAYINYSAQLKMWGVELSNIQRYYL